MNTLTFIKIIILLSYVKGVIFNSNQTLFCNSDKQLKRLRKINQKPLDYLVFEDSDSGIKALNNVGIDEFSIVDQADQKSMYFNNPNLVFTIPSLTILDKSIFS